MMKEARPAIVGFPNFSPSRALTTDCTASTAPAVNASNSSPFMSLLPLSHVWRWTKVLRCEALTRRACFAHVLLPGFFRPQDGLCSPSAYEGEAGPIRSVGDTLRGHAMPKRRPTRRKARGETGGEVCA